MQQRGAGADGVVRRKPAPRQMFHFTITPTARMDAMVWRVLVCTQILGTDAATAAEYAARFTWTGKHNTEGITQADVGRAISISIEAGLYRSLRSSAGAETGAASTPEGTARTAEFNALPAADKDAVNREADRRFWLRTGAKPGTKLGRSAADRDNARLWLDIRDEVLRQRQALAGLPSDVQKALGGLASFEPGDYAQLTRVANRLTAEEWADYLSRVTARGSSLDQLEASVDAYAQRRHESEAHVAAFRTQQVKLAGTEELYVRYQDYLAKKRLARPTTVRLWRGGGTLFISPPESRVEEAERAGKDLTASLIAAGFKGGIPDFEASMAAFVTAFEQQAVAIGVTVLDRYESFLYRQSQYYLDNAVISRLYDSLAPLRADYAKFAEHNKLAVVTADEYERQQELSRLPSYGEVHPDPALQRRSEAAHAAAEADKQRSISDVRALVPQHPIFSESHLPLNRRIPKEALAQADKAGVKQILAQHIADRTSDVRDARAQLLKDPESVYKMDQLLAEARLQLDVTPGSIFDTLINEKIDQIHRDETVIAVIVGVLALAFTIMTLGTGAVAVVGAVGPWVSGASASTRNTSGTASPRPRPAAACRPKSPARPGSWSPSWERSGTWPRRAARSVHSPSRPGPSRRAVR